MAEEIDLEKCNFRKFKSPVTLTLTLTLDRVEIILMHICGRVYPHTKLDRNRKNFLWTYGWTDTPEFQSIRSLTGDDLKITVRWYGHVKTRMTGWKCIAYKVEG